MLDFAMDRITVADAAKRLANRPGFALLDSTGEHGDLARFSFIGVDPFATFQVIDGIAHWNGEPLAGEPLALLRERLRAYDLPRGDGAFPFRGGVIGYLAYDFGKRLEKLDEPARSDHGLDELRFDVYDLVLGFDRLSGEVRLFSSGFPETGDEARARRAKLRAEALIGWLSEAAPEGEGGSRLIGPWQSNFTPKAYEAAVSRVKDYILAGDIYQANIAQRFTCELSDGFDAFAFYETLRAANPAPFGAFLRSDEAAIACSSPERFLSCRNGQVEARPIKGTARSNPDPARDAAVAAGLLSSEKDRAENTMIVDLLRNDLSRVARPGTVKVPTLCGLETYEGLHHLTSVVKGELRDGLDGLDLLAATFPGGSITGAPKLRAMDIITEIEGVARGVYCGAIGYIGFDGDLDFNIAIRTVTLTPGRAQFSAGGGVTLLSDPTAEHAETLVKADRIFKAFRRHAGGDA